jgi:hypothetical protein
MEPVDNETSASVRDTVLYIQSEGQLTVDMPPAAVVSTNGYLFVAACNSKFVPC